LDETATSSDNRTSPPHKVPGIKISGGIDLDHYGDTPANVKTEWVNGPAQVSHR
jgi:hypothetical protein